MQKTPFLTATNVLILLCVLAFAATESLYSNTRSGFELFYFENSMFQPHQLLTHMFLHGGPTHLFFNMFGLWMFGNTLEKFWGMKKFVTFYLLCGLGAAAFYMTLNYFQFQSATEPLVHAGVAPEKFKAIFEINQYYEGFTTSLEALKIFQSPVKGASGALYGVLVAFAFMFPNNKIRLIFLPVPIAAKFFVPALLALDIFSEFTGFSIFGHNIAHAAHVGGAVTAAILMLVWIKRKPKKPNLTILK